MLYYILSKKETKIFVICTVSGAILQFFSRRYIKNHPEFLEEPEITIKIKNPSGTTEELSNEKAKEIAKEIAKEPTLHRLIKYLRGGQIQQKIVEILVKLLIKWLIKLMAKYGIEIGLTIGTGIVIKATPKKALARIIERSLPQDVFNKGRFTQVNGEKIDLENCSEGFKYMFSVLMDKEIPYDEKQKHVRYVFRVTLDKAGPVNLILCLIPILLILATQSPASYFLLLKNLIQAIKEGRISKRVARMIARRLLKEGQLVDPELLDLIES